MTWCHVVFTHLAAAANKLLSVRDRPAVPLVDETEIRRKRRRQETEWGANVSRWCQWAPRIGFKEWASKAPA